MTLSATDRRAPSESQESLSMTSLRRTPKLDDGTPEEKRREIALYFTNTFDTYTRLFDCLADDAGFYKKSIPLRHPLIFYLGHTATFSLTS